MTFTDNVWYYLGYDTENNIEPSQETIKQRHLVMKQIKLSKMRLKCISKPPVKKVRFKHKNKRHLN
jgi:hypothetical protein